MSKPTYQELVEGLKDLLNATYEKDGHRRLVITQKDYLDLRDAYGKAARLIREAKGWETKSVAEHVNDDGTNKDA